MIQGVKIRLKPTLEQKDLFNQSAGIHRFIYNWTLERQQNNYKNGEKFISDYDLRKEVTQMKKQPEYQWLGNVSNDVPKQSVKDACQSFKRFFKKQAKYPRFKRKTQIKQSFYCDTHKTKLKNKSVFLSKIGWVRTSEILPDVDKIMNPRVVFDGKYWYITFAYEKEIQHEPLTNEILGIDLGLKDLAILSNNVVFKNINKSQKVKRLEKKLRRLQRNCSRKYEMNKTEERKIAKTSNIYKIEKKIRLLYRKLKNIRLNYIHQMTSYIVRTKPYMIVIEDLNVSGMLKNKHLSKSVYQQLFYEIRRQLAYKTERMNIELIIADRYYPSTQRCSCCGHVKTKEHKLTLKDRIYKCDECNHVMDRDLNAALNLKEYPFINFK